MGMTVNRIRIGGFLTTNVVKPKPTKIEIYMIGGGGGGSGSIGTPGTSGDPVNTQFGGGGGGAGGLYTNINVNIVAGTTYNFVIGMGGAGGLASSNGSKGEDTTWTSSGGPTYTAFGGGAGVLFTSTAANGGCGGGCPNNGATIGTAVTGQGFLGQRGSLRFGGGGGGIFPLNAFGNNGQAPGTGRWIPDGRKGFLFLGPGGTGGTWTITTGSIPASPKFYGEGGAGAPWRNNSAQPGISGRQGIIIVCYQSTFAPAVSFTGGQASVVSGWQYYYLTSNGSIRW